MARKFRFRLETVERLRRQSRDTQRRVVAEHVRAVEAVRRQIEALMQSKATTDEATRATLRIGTVNADSLRQHQWHRNWLERSLAGAERERQKRQAELDEQLARLGELSKELKVIEKLRERQWARFRVDVAREEQREHDEAALGRFGRLSRAWRDEVPA